MSGIGTPRGQKKLDFFEKKSIFLTWLNIQHYSREARNGRNFCRTPNFSTFTIFQLSCKKIMSETFLGQKLCHGVKSRLNLVVTFWEGFILRQKTFIQQCGVKNINYKCTVCHVRMG